MPASALYLMDLKGKILLSRNYRGDIPMSTSDKFTKHMYDHSAHTTARTALQPTAARSSAHRSSIPSPLLPPFPPPVPVPLPAATKTRRRN